MEALRPASLAALVALALAAACGSAAAPVDAHFGQALWSPLEERG